MLKMKESVEQVAFERQLQDHRSEPLVLMILFTLDAGRGGVQTASAWDAAFTKGKPGFISAQLHQGIEGRATFLDYAAFESFATFAAMTRRPEFGPLHQMYPVALRRVFTSYDGSPSLVSASANPKPLDMRCT